MPLIVQPKLTRIRCVSFSDARENMGGGGGGGGVVAL